jgi:hypothetical protein
MGWELNGTKRTLKFSITKTEEEGKSFLNLAGQSVTTETRNFNFQNPVSGDITFPFLALHSYTALDNTAFARLSQIEYDLRRSRAKAWITNNNGDGWNLSDAQWADLVRQADIYFKIEADTNNEKLVVRSYSDAAKTIPLVVTQSVSFAFTYYHKDFPNDKYNNTIVLNSGASVGYSSTFYYMPPTPLDNSTVYLENPIFPSSGYQYEFGIFRIILNPTQPQYRFVPEHIEFDYFADGIDKPQIPNQL